MAIANCTACGASCSEFDVRCAGCGAALPSVSVSGRTPRTSAGTPRTPGRDDSARPFAATLQGEKIGPYEIVDRLGVGGMGVVYRAVDRQLGRSVALKFLSTRLAHDARARARIVREARVVSALDHPAIATIYEIGEHDGRPFIAMALYEGETLKAALAKGPFPVARAVRAAREVASGLAAAHAAGIVHRDVKPDNVLLTRAGTVKVLDFGLAKVSEGNQHDEAQLTREGAVLGTISYMAPEQLRGEVVDARADLWSLGVLLYELITGELPFGANATRILSEEPDPIDVRAPDVPAPLAALVASLLRKDAAQRPQQATDVEQRLRAVELELGSAASSLDVGAPVAATPGVEPGGEPAPSANEADPLGWLGGTIDAHVRIDAVVGEGGFGVVYRGRHLGFDEIVAVKCLKIPAQLTDAQRATFLHDFREEAKLLHRLSRKTTAIVQALDVGAATSPSGIWTPYIVMEWLEGMTLEADVQTRRQRGLPARSVRQAAELLTPAVQALGVAHASGIAHLDVKPANLFLATVEGAPTLKVLDFGIAKVLASSDTLTHAITAHGGLRPFTPNYGAPEQFNKRHGTRGPPTDVFALGLVLLETCSARPALDGDSALQLYVASANDEVRPTFAAHGVPANAALEAVLARALAVDPNARYPDASSFWQVLTTALSSESPGELATAPTRIVVVHDGDTPHPGPTITPTRSAAMPTVSVTALSGEHSVPPPRRRSRIFAAIALAVVAIGITAVAVGMGSGAPDRAAPALSATAETPPTADTSVPSVTAMPAEPSTASPDGTGVTSFAPTASASVRRLAIGAKSPGTGAAGAVAKPAPSASAKGNPMGGGIF